MPISTCKGNCDCSFATKTSISVVKSRKKLIPLLTLLFFISGLLFSQSGFSQAKCPDLNCTANDVQINSVFLGDANGNALVESCEPGTEQTAYLYIDFSTNAPRNGLYFSATLNGETLSTCFGQLLTGSSTRVRYPTQIDYTCGETLTLTNIFLAYNPGQDNFCDENPTGVCANIITSKCSRLPSVVVKAPLVADFTALGSCPTTGQQAFQTFTFSTNITGGTPNYSYSIDFGDGNTATGTSTDGTETLTHTYTSGGSKTVVLTVTDANERTDSHTETINVEPCCQIAVTCPTPDDSYNTDANECNATLSFSATIPQNCTGATITYSVNNNPITFPYDFPIGTTTVTVTATDAADNTATCNFDVVVEDNQDPGITCPTVQSSYNTDANDCNASLSFTATASDNCTQSPTIVYKVNDQTITFPYDFPVGTTTVTAIATDNAGNTAQCSFDVVVADDVDPGITCPTVQSSYNTDANDCNASLSFTATASDNCTQSPTVVYKVNDQTITFPYDFPVGTTTVTAIATDDAGNTAQCSFDVVVADDVDPGITCPTVQSSYNTDANDCNATLSFTATASDNCTQSPTIVYKVNDQTITFPYDFPVGTTTVTAIATDDAGNTAQCSFDVVVADDVDPGITCPTVQSSYNTDATDCNATLSFTATASDNCTQLPTVVYKVNDQTITFPYDFPVGTTTVTAIATDDAGNTAQCSFDVVVADDVNPGITCPTPAASYNTDANECNATLTFTANGSDNCGTATVTYKIGEQAITFPYDFPLGNTTVTATATDDAGNTTSCNFTVVVADNQVPGITCPTPNAKYYTDLNECNATLSFTATATDNCSTPTVTYKVGTQTITFPYDFPVGSTIVTATATDAANNTASCNFTVVVVDKQRPVITCPQARTVSCASNVPPVATSKSAFTTQGGSFSDNCAVQSINHVSDVVTTCTTNSYTITRTYTATDVNGNVSLPCTQLITVNTTVSTPCFNYNLLSRTVNSTGTTFTFQVCSKQNCAALSYVAFVIPKGIRVISPTNGSTYKGMRNSYRVSVPVNNTQHGVKYEAIGEGIKNGACDVFTFTLAGNQSNLNIEVITKAGNKTYPAVVNSSCISCQSSNNLTTLRSVVDPTINMQNLTVTASPNPFKDRVRFEVESGGGQGSLEVFNTLGQRVATIYKGYMPAGKQVFEYITPAALRMNVIYVVTVGDKRVTGKLINLK